jgi:hypothetical protein
MLRRNEWCAAGFWIGSSGSVAAGGPQRPRVTLRFLTQCGGNSDDRWVPRKCVLGPAAARDRCTDFDESTRSPRHAMINGGINGAQSDPCASSPGCPLDARGVRLALCDPHPRNQEHNVTCDPHRPSDEFHRQLPAEVRWKADNYNDLLEQRRSFSRRSDVGIPQHRLRHRGVGLGCSADRA